MAAAGLAAALVGRLDPLDLKRLIGGADDAGHLDRDAALPEVGEWISLTGITVEKPGAALTGEVVATLRARIR